MVGATFKLEVKVARGRNTPTQLKAIKRKVQNDRAVQVRFANGVRQRAINNIRGGRGPEGRFRPLKPSTLLRRQQRGRASSRPLIESGRMVNSIQVRNRRAGKITETTIQPSQNELLKAAVHQRGSRSGKIPARPFLGFTRTDESRYKRDYENHVKKAIRTR